MMMMKTTSPPPTPTPTAILCYRDSEASGDGEIPAATMMTMTTTMIVTMLNSDDSKWNDMYVEVELASGSLR